MNLHVVTFVNYAPSKQSANGYKFVRLLKGAKHIRDLGFELGAKNQQQTIEWFGELVAGILRPKHSIVLVPIPNSNCLVGGKVVPRTKYMADAIAMRMKHFQVWDALRWRRELRAAHEGGVRDSLRLIDALEITRELPKLPCVLIDDVITTGGHLIACASKLHRSGARCEHALCLARVAKREQEKQFEVVQTHITFHRSNNILN